MAGFRKFPKLTTSYTHVDNAEAKHKEEETSRNARPSSAPSSSQAGRKLLANRQQQQNKPYYKVTYPLRQRRKVNLEDQCNSAPNAEYIVDGRGYTFTRHNNKLTMNIDTNIFFDDKVATANDTSRKKPSSPTLVTQKQRVSLQRQLEESLQVQEKLHKTLVEASVKLEEQKLEQENEREKLLKEHERSIKEITKLHEEEKIKLKEDNEEAVLNLQTIHRGKLAEQQTAQANMDILLKEKVQYLNTKIKENNQRHEVELVRSLEEKEEVLNSKHLKALSDLRTELTNDFKKQQSMRIKTLEKQYEHTLAEKTVKHKNEIEDLISRFKDSAQIEEDFKKASKLLKDCETEIEQLNLEKNQLTVELRSCKAELQETMGELYQYKQKFQKKVDEVKEQCDDTINHLTLENIDLRKRLLKKTEELSDLRMEEDKRLRNIQFNLKKSVIQARIKANLPVALGIHKEHVQSQDEGKERQGSAPITKQEKDGHRRRISSMEQEELSHSAASTHTAKWSSPQHSTHSSKDNQPPNPN